MRVSPNLLLVIAFPCKPAPLSSSPLFHKYDAFLVSPSVLPVQGLQILESLRSRNYQLVHVSACRTARGISNSHSRRTQS